MIESSYLHGYIIAFARSFVIIFLLSDCKLNGKCIMNIAVTSFRFFSYHRISCFLTIIADARYVSTTVPMK